MIPPKPQTEDYTMSDYFYALGDWEHLVAKRAVEALRQCMDRPAFGDDYAEEALAEIEASGWKE